MAEKGFRCVRCGSEYKATNLLYRGNTRMFKVYGGFLPMCKKCISELFLNLCIEFKGTEQLALRRLCSLLDVYYDEELYEECIAESKVGVKGGTPEEVKKKRIDLYLKKVYVRFPNRTFLDNMKEEQGWVEGSDSKNTMIKSIQENTIRPDTIKRFGSNYTPEELLFLQNQYDDWVLNYECNSKSQDELFTLLCINKLSINQAKRAGKPTKDHEQQFRSNMAALGITPDQNKFDESESKRTFGKMIQEWENDNPIGETEEKYKDIDRLGLYIDVFYKGHALKSLGINKGISALYDKFMKKYTAEKNISIDDETDEGLFTEIFGKGLEDEEF